MIRVATNGVRTRLQATREWLATDRRWAIAAVAVLSLVIITNDAQVDLTPIVLSAVLVIVGIALVRSEAPGDTTHEAQATDAAPATRAARVRRPRSKLFPLTLAAVFAAMGIALVLDTATELRLEPGRFSALALVVVGAGLSLGGWWGRARLLIPLGLALIPVVLISSLAHVDLYGKIGPAAVFPLRAGELPPKIDVVAGSATINLTQLRLEGRDEYLVVELGLGEVDILLPQRFETEIHSILRGGRMSVLGRQQEGTNLTAGRVVHADLADKGTLTLDIRAGVGSVAIDQIWARHRGAHDKHRKSSAQRKDDRNRSGPHRKKNETRPRDREADPNKKGRR